MNEKITGKPAELTDDAMIEVSGGKKSNKVPSDYIMCGLYLGDYPILYVNQYCEQYCINNGTQNCIQRCHTPSIYNEDIEIAYNKWAKRHNLS